MDHRDRVFTALRGERPDHVPVGMWWHDFARENSAADLASATVSNALAYDFDYVKVQSRFTVFAECWGARWRPSGQLAMRPTQVEPAVRVAADLDRVATLAPDTSPLEEQLEALRLIKRALADSRPVIMTVFSPLMALLYCFPDGPGARAAMVAALREDPARADRVLGALTAVLTRFAGDCVAEGADGIFFSSNLASSDFTTVDDLRRFQRPYDLKVLAAAAPAAFNMVHVCGFRTHFAEFADYPAACFSWALGDGNPSLQEGRTTTRRAAVGGISGKPELTTMTPAEVAREVEAAIETTGGRGLLLGPACTIDAATPEANLRAAVGAARRPFAEGVAGSSGPG